jgi:hypothetical protein
VALQTWKANVDRAGTFFGALSEEDGPKFRQMPNFGLPVNCIAADILRIKDGMLVEHWDVIQDEATKQVAKSGLPMFGDNFTKRINAAA